MCKLNFSEQLNQRVFESPNATAIQFREHKLTYSELAGRMGQLKRHLPLPGGARVVILLPDLLDTYVWYLFLFVSRAVIIPVSVQATSLRIKYIIDHVKPHLVVTTDLLHESHKDVLSDLPCVVLNVPYGETVPRGNLKITASARLPSNVACSDKGQQDKTRFIIFTSGSTGIPKGVCLSENNIISAADMMVDFLPVDSKTKSMVTVPFYDYYGLIQIFGHILGGGSYILGLNPSFAKQFYGVLKDESVTDLVVVPYTLKRLTEVSRDAGENGMSTLRRITSSSDMLTADILARTFELNPNVTIVNIYGLTEAGRACYRKINRDTPFSKSIGRASKGVKVRIEGPVRGLGEIVLSGPNVMLGYFDRIVDDRVVFKPCNEMWTGDIGCLDEAGEILLVGRKDHMINLMGAKIHPSEIESAALRINGISDARAQLRPGQDGKPYIELEVVFAHHGLSSAMIKDELKKVLPRMFVPSSVCEVSKIARTELGSKIVR